MFTVEFYLKGQSKDCRRFPTLEAALRFKRAMMENPDCEGVWIVRPD